MAELKLREIYNHSITYFKATEARQFDRAFNYYNGQFYQQSAREARYSDSANVTASSLSSKNIIYAIVDTALSSMIGSSLGVAMNPRNQYSETRRTETEAYLDYVFNENKMRRRSTSALLDSILYGRGIFKTWWDSKADIARIKTIHPARMFFDLEARDPADITYWMEVNPISTKEFKKRVASKMYQGKGLDDLSGHGYPEWLDTADPSKKTLRQAFRWITVVEYFDVKESCVYHWLPSCNQIVYKEELPFCPYTMFFLSPNGTDCRGLSEVQLVLDDQEALNAMKSLLNEIAFLSIPKTVFDDSILDANSASRIAQAPVGSWNALGRGESRTPGGGAPMRIEDIISRVPYPESPLAAIDAANRAQDDASFVTAFSDQSRGQVQNVRTALEMAFIQAQTETRTVSRKAMFFEAIEEVASKMFAYAREYMQSPIEVRTADKTGWVQIDRWIAEVNANWQVLAYNPLRDNPAVLGERVLSIMPLIQALPDYDQRRVHEFLLESLHLPSFLLRPKEEVEAEMAAAMEAEAAAAAPAGPAGPTAGPDELADAEAAIDPQMAADLVELGAEAGPEGLAELEAQVQAVLAGP